MTDRLGSSGPGRDPRIGRPEGVQAPQGIEAIIPQVGAPSGRQAGGPRIARDGLAISEDTRAYYAALVNGAPPPANLAPELAQRLAMLHGPNSDLFQSMRESQAGQAQLALPAGQAQLALPAAAAAEPPSATSTFFSRALREMNYAWQEFANTQAW